MSYIINSEDTKIEKLNTFNPLNRANVSIFLCVECHRTL